MMFRTPYFVYSRMHAIKGKWALNSELPRRHTISPPMTYCFRLWNDRISLLLRIQCRTWPQWMRRWWKQPHALNRNRWFVLKCPSIGRASRKMCTNSFRWHFPMDDWLSNFPKIEKEKLISSWLIKWSIFPPPAWLCAAV